MMPYWVSIKLAKGTLFTLVWKTRKSFHCFESGKEIILNYTFKPPDFSDLLYLVFAV